MSASRSTKKESMNSRRTFLKQALLSVPALGLPLGCSVNRPSGPNRKVIVLGFDGLDPVILGRMVRAGHMPNFARVLERGDLRPLGTTNPPLSPVAWATFTTGVNPGGHGIFDFVHRDPETMTPYLSTTRAEAPGQTIRLGDWVIPLSSGKIRLLREGKPFWQTLEERGIPTRIVHAPANFPAEGAGHQLSGMGTPDLQGTYGVYSFFTNDPSMKAGAQSGGEVFQVRMVDHRVHARLLGPRNTFRADAPQSGADFMVSVDPSNGVAKIALHDQAVLLKKGEWSGWMPVRFDLVPYMQSVSGIVRFYLKETHPHLKLYASPVNIDPANPALPISTPHEYAHDLSCELGSFYTQGMPHDTKALSNGILDDEEFLQQAELVFDEHSRLFDLELARFRRGLLFFYTDRVDQVAHMFWRSMDPDHPLHAAGSRHAGVIEKIYRDMDVLVGKALPHVDADTTLLVMSDHGFAPFYRALDLNAWLKKEGFLQTAAGRPGGEGPLDQMDWGTTRAYGLGLNGLYLNLRGREAYGIVGRPETDRLLADISGRLLQLKDPKTGQQVVKRVYRAQEIFSGEARAFAPDLVVGYDRGYRVSWGSVLGSVSDELFSDNADKWSGDHAMAAETVPGVLVTSRKATATQPSLADLAPTVLQEFGIAKPDVMEGRSVL
jgi:predicted AlkP superfamily phosphohydrolase/phosphomutase